MSAMGVASFAPETYRERVIVRPCSTCGIAARWTRRGWVHVEGRTLANGLHNGTPDHNARVSS